MPASTPRTEFELTGALFLALVSSVGVMAGPSAVSQG